MAVLKPACVCFVAVLLMQAVGLAADISSDIEKAKRDHAAKLARIKLQVRDLEQATVKRMEKLAVQAVKKGDLTAATRAWKEVLSLDREHEEARQHFQTIGQLEKTLDELPQSAGSTTLPIAHERLRQKMSGTLWRWNKTQFFFRADGVLMVPGDQNTVRRWSVFDRQSVVIKHPSGFYDLMVLDPSFTKYQAHSLGRPTKMPRWNGRGRRLK